MYDIQVMGGGGRARGYLEGCVLGYELGVK